MEIPSETEMVPNSNGYPPAAWTPSLTAFASRSRERLQGVISFQLEATPICGLAKSSSPIPTARSIPREAVASRPSVTTRDRGLMSGWPFRPTWSECGPRVCGCAVMAVQSSAYRSTGLGCSHRSGPQRHPNTTSFKHQLPGQADDQHEADHQPEVDHHLLQKCERSLPGA